MTSKRSAIKRISECIWDSDKSPWTVHKGELEPRGRQTREKNLFKVVGEKLPWECLNDVSSDLRKDLKKGTVHGVYMAHDSMGCPRYVGLGRIFRRLKSHKRAHALELVYFSFYVPADRSHQREIETLLIRAAGPLLQFNTQKKRVTIERGRISDYQAGTRFYERHRKKGKRAKGA